VNDRLDEAMIEQLRGWGAGLAADGDDERRAAGKAILLLIEEIERLQIDAWNAKATQEQDRPEDHADADDQLEASVDRTLRSRLNRIRSNLKIDNWLRKAGLTAFEPTPPNWEGSSAVAL